MVIGFLTRMKDNENKNIGSGSRNEKSVFGSSNIQFYPTAINWYLYSRPGDAFHWQDTLFEARVQDGMGVSVGDGSGAGVSEGDGSGVFVVVSLGVGVKVGVNVGVSVGVSEGVLVAGGGTVLTGLLVFVGVIVLVLVGVWVDVVLGVAVTVCVKSKGVVVSVKVGVRLVGSIVVENVSLAGGSTIGEAVPAVNGMRLFCLESCS